MMMNLQDHFLIATPDLEDDYFSHSVVYICDHNDDGALGLVISAPTDLSVMELLAKMDFLIADSRDYTKDQMVLSGGPIKPDHGFILHTKTNQEFLASKAVTDRIMLTTSGDILETLGRLEAPEKFLVCLGYSSWYAGQLENEIAQNDWLVVPADEHILFDVGYLERWNAAKELLGINGILSKAGFA